MQKNIAFYMESRKEESAKSHKSNRDFDCFCQCYIQKMQDFLKELF